MQEMPLHISIFAFMLSELKKGFQIGFMIFLPFIVIDMIVASALVSVGLMFLPPATLSLPFKIVLFILIDGWNILSEGLVLSFRGG
jgi:flagellar biosynthesis protein FliP